VQAGKQAAVGGLVGGLLQGVVGPEADVWGTITLEAEGDL
jgi:hypothetical protein